MECFRGRLGPELLWMGGKVDDRPGGDPESIDGKSSLFRLKLEKGSDVGSRLLGYGGGSSIDRLIACLCASVSDIQSCQVVNWDLIGIEYITNIFRLPIWLEFMVMELREGCRCTSGGQHRSRMILINCSWSIGRTRILTIDAVPVISIALRNC